VRGCCAVCRPPAPCTTFRAAPFGVLDGFGDILCALGASTDRVTNGADGLHEIAVALGVHFVQQAQHVAIFWAEHLEKGSNLWVLAGQWRKVGVDDGIVVVALAERVFAVESTGALIITGTL
jgi:hypothetical protein